MNGLRSLKRGDFDLQNKPKNRSQVFENDNLEVLFEEDSAKQFKNSLGDRLSDRLEYSTIIKCLHAFGKIQKADKWVLHELTERNIESYLNMCVTSCHKRKSFIWKIVTENKKRIYYENPKRQKAWLDSGQSSTPDAKKNIHGKKVLLCIGMVKYEDHALSRIAEA